MSVIRDLWPLLRDTFTEFMAVHAPRIGAALAFYTVLSIAPLLIIALSIAGAVLGEEAARGELTAQMERLIGETGAAAVQDMIAAAGQPGGTIWGALIGLGTLLFTATIAFNELQSALNTVWRIRTKDDAPWWEMLRTRVLSFGMVLAFGFLLLVSLVISTALSAIDGYLQGMLPDYGPLLQVLNVVVSFLVIGLLFALIFKFLPDIDLDWQNVWFGAGVTALLFVAGKYLIGLYLGQAGIASYYGAAGSFVVLLLWVYYSAQILLFGAEFTRVYCLRHGCLPPPRNHAEYVDAHPEHLAADDDDEHRQKQAGE